jgi:hypothetical protein
MTQGIDHPIPEIAPTALAKADPTVAAIETEKRPLQTLAAPVGGQLTNDAHVKWIETMATTYEQMPDDIKDALILMQRSFPATGGGCYFLTPPQAMMIVRYCRAKKLEVHADHWWFDPRNYRIGSTVSGLRAEARNNNLNLGAPVCTPLTRPWPAHSPHIKGYDGADFGYKCSIRVNNGDAATYDAWFSTSAATSKPDARGIRELRVGPWSDNAEHMLQIRAQGNALKVAMGSGVSEPIDSTDSTGGQ